MEKTILIFKEVGPKMEQAIRINSEADIPMFLLNSIMIVCDKIHFISDEQHDDYPLNSVIKWELDDSARTGYSCKCIDPVSENLIEKDGSFYKTTILKALAISDKYPEFLEGANITQNHPNMSWSINENGKCIATASSGDGYWVLCGIKEDNTPDVSFLLKTDPSYSEYMVCNENGRFVSDLSEWDSEN